MTDSSRFCSQCGVEARPDASYCVACGTALGGGGRPAPAARVAPAGADATRRFAPLIVVAILVGICGLAVGIGYRSQPAPNQPLARGGTAASAPGAIDGAQQLPGDHPPLEVPENVRQVIARMEALATEQPDDLEAWKQLAFVQYRAGQFDKTYLDAAEKSYRHVLTRDEDDLDALRGLGNVAYDRNDPAKALDYYRQFLLIEPGNKEVRTDMATMLLAAQQPEEAIRAYQGVLQEDPTFFQAQFNLAIAYRAAGQGDLALAALQRAKEVAPDDDSRQRVETLLAHVQSGGAAAAAPQGSLRDAVEAVFRSHPIVGPRIDAFRWESDRRARVTLREFPMQGMPPMVREKFVERLTSGIRDSKKRFDSTEPLAIDIVDAGSGDTMITIAD
jgi:cytochrome c-type biogenesis protein CcmH/NrfG